MKISVKSLEKIKACEPGVELFRKTYGDKEIDASEALLKFAKLKPKYSIWWLTETFSKEHNVKLAIYSAELVLHIFEDKYPDDDRPRKAIEMAKEYLKNPTEKNRATASSACSSAFYASSAASSAFYASSAASSAAYSAYAASSASAYASSAAYAAYSAYAASAYAAIDYAAAASDYDYKKAKGEIYLKIIKYGIKLLKRTEK